MATVKAMLAARNSFRNKEIEDCQDGLFSPPYTRMKTLFIPSYALLTSAVVILAAAAPGREAHASAGAAAAGAITPVAMAALCGGGGMAAGAALGPAGMALGAMAANLCTPMGVALMSAAGSIGSALIGEMSKGDKGKNDNMGGGGYFPPPVSGLPVVANADNSFNADALKKAKAEKKPEYGPWVPQVAMQRAPEAGTQAAAATARPTFNTRSDTSSFRIGSGATNNGGALGGVRLSNGQPAPETGIRFGGFADGGTQIAINTPIVGDANEQMSDWFTLGFSDAREGRDRRREIGNPSELFQYESGLEAGYRFMGSGRIV